MKRIFVFLVLLFLSTSFVIATEEVRNVELDIKIYYEGQREFKIKIYAYDEEIEETFSWATEDIGDTRRWEATNVELRINDKLEKIDIPFKVWYEGEWSAKIRADGYDKDSEEKSFSWTSTQIGEYFSWKPVINYKFEVTEEEIHLEDVKIWKNLTLELAQSRKNMENMTIQCYDIIRLNNESHMIAREYADLREGVGNMGAKLEDCRNETVELKPFKSLYEDCNSDKLTYKTERDTCTREKESLKEQGGSGWLIYGLIGAAVGFFFAKRKEQKPQELNELGDVGIPP